MVMQAVIQEKSNRIVEVLLKAKEGEVIISVKDYGLGIRKEDRDKIFSRFYRAGNELTQYVKGSGIGLTIVKKIVDAHKGKIVVDSEPGKGSTFIIVLPFANIPPDKAEIKEGLDN